MDWDSTYVEIFRAGSYGDKGTWTEGDLDRMIANFEAGVWKPPAVIGHPETNSPAMAWVEKLARQGKTLLAKFSQVQPELTQAVTSGRFPNRSAAIYTDPQGKGPVLRHVGFLGAVPPEVKGLAPIKFASTDFTEITFEEESMNPEEQKKTIMEAVKAYFAELFGQKPAPSAAPTFTEEQVQARITAATQPILDQLKTIGTQFTELNAKLQTSASDVKRAAAKAFVEKLKAANKWVPAYDAMGMGAMLENLAVSGGTVKFGEAGKEVECSSYDALCKFLEQSPAIVPTGNITGKVKDSKGNVVQFNEARGIDLDTQSIAFDERVRKVMADNPKLDYGQAMRIAAEQSA